MGRVTERMPIGRMPLSREGGEAVAIGFEEGEEAGNGKDGADGGGDELAADGLEDGKTKVLPQESIASLRYS
jgi:hypothetical protein